MVVNVLDEHAVGLVVATHALQLFLVLLQQLLSEPVEDHGGDDDDDDDGFKRHANDG